MFSAAVALVPSTGWTIPRTRKLTLNHLGRAAARAASNERTISVPPDEPIRAPLERSSPSNTAAAAAAAAPCCCCCPCCFLLLLLLVLSATADSSVLTVRRGSFSPDDFSEQEEGELSPALLSDDDGTLL